MSNTNKLLLFIFLFGFIIQVIKTIKLHKCNSEIIDLSLEFTEILNENKKMSDVANQICHLYVFSNFEVEKLIVINSYILGPNNYRYSPLNFLLNFKDDEYLFRKELNRAIILIKADLKSNMNHWYKEYKKSLVGIINPFDHIYNTFETLFELAFGRMKRYFKDISSPVNIFSKIMTILSSILTMGYTLLQMIEWINPNLKQAITLYFQRYIP